MKSGRVWALLAMTLLTMLQSTADATSFDGRKEGRTGFWARTSGSPLPTMGGHWQEGTATATLRFGGSSLGSPTTFRALWKTDFADSSSIEGTLTATIQESSGQNISLSSRLRYQVQGQEWSRWISQPVQLTGDELEDQTDFSFTPWAPGKQLRFQWELRGTLQETTIISTVELWLGDG